MTAGGAKLHVASAGRPPQESATSALKPLAERMVQVEVALLPCTMVSDDGLQATLKSGASVSVGMTSAQLLTGL